MKSIKNSWEKIVKAIPEAGISRDDLVKKTKRSWTSLYNIYWNHRGEGVVYDKEKKVFFSGQASAAQHPKSGRASSFLPKEFSKRYEDLMAIGNDSQKERGLDLIYKGAEAIRLLDAVLENINLKNKLDKLKTN